MTLVSQKIFAIIGLKKMYFKIPRNLDLENVTLHFANNRIIIGKKTKERFYNTYFSCTFIIKMDLNL